MESLAAIVVACWMLGCGGPDLSLNDYAITKIAAPEQEPVFGVDTLATRSAGAGTWMGITDAGTWMASGGAYRNPAGPVHVNLIDASGAVVDSWMIDWEALGFRDYGEVQAFTVDDRGRFWVLYYHGQDPALIEINIATGEVERRIPCPSAFTRKQYLVYADGHLFVGGQVETYLLEYDVATGALVKDYASTIVNDLQKSGADIEGLSAANGMLLVRENGNEGALYDVMTGELLGYMLDVPTGPLASARGSFSGRGNLSKAIDFVPTADPMPSMPVDYAVALPDARAKMIAFSGERVWIYFDSSDGAELVGYDPDTLQPVSGFAIPDGIRQQMHPDSYDYELKGLAADGNSFFVESLYVEGLATLSTRQSDVWVIDKGSHDLKRQYTLADIAATDLCYRDNTLWAVQRFKVPPAVVEPQIVGLDPQNGLPNSSVMTPIAVPGNASLACTSGGWLYGGDRGHGWVGLGEQPDDATQRAVVPYREAGSSVTVHDGKAWMLDRTRHLIMVVDLISVMAGGSASGHDRVAAVVVIGLLAGCSGGGEARPVDLQRFEAIKAPAPVQPPVYPIVVSGTRRVSAGVWMAVTDAGVWMAQGGGSGEPAFPMHMTLIGPDGGIVDSKTIDWSALGYSSWGHVRSFTADDRGRFWVHYEDRDGVRLAEINIATGQLERTIPAAHASGLDNFMTYADGRLYDGGSSWSDLREYDVTSGALVADLTSAIVQKAHDEGSDLHGIAVVDGVMLVRENGVEGELFNLSTLRSLGYVTGMPAGLLASGPGVFVGKTTQGEAVNFLPSTTPLPEMPVEFSVALPDEGARMLAVSDGVLHVFFDRQDGAELVDYDADTLQAISGFSIGDSLHRQMRPNDIELPTAMAVDDESFFLESFSIEQIGEANRSSAVWVMDRQTHAVTSRYDIYTVGATGLCYRDGTVWAADNTSLSRTVVQPRIVGVDPATGLPTSSTLAPLPVPGFPSVACVDGGWLYSGDAGRTWVALTDVPGDPGRRMVLPYREAGSSVSVYDGKAWMLNRRRNVILVADLP